MTLEEKLVEIDNEIYEKYKEIRELKYNKVRVECAIYARDWNKEHGWKEVPI